VTANARTIAGYLRWVHEHALGLSPGVVVFNSITENRRRSGCYRFDQLDQAAIDVAAASNRGVNMFYRLHLLDEPVDVFHRGSSAQTRWITHLAGDDDIAGPGHKPPEGTILPATVGEAVELIGATLAPQMIVSSGGGLYPVWRLDDPVDLAVGDNRQRVIDVGTRLDRALNAHGFHVDAVCKDLARVIRPAGVDNCKPGRDVRPVTVLRGWTDAPADYSLADLEALLPALPVKQPTLRRDEIKRPPSGTRTASADDISVFTIFAELYSLEDVLEADTGHQWERVADQKGGMEAYRYVGSSSAYSIKRDPETGVVIVWSATIASELGMNAGDGRDLWGFACRLAGRDPTEAARVNRGPR
jgi:hypothetical protein